MTPIDTQQILIECEIITEYIERCRKSHKKISTRFLFEKGKSIMDYAYQCHCLSQGRIPVCGIYNF